MIQRTLVLLKPDSVQRSLCGEIIHRFEKVGLKIIGMKMVWINSDFAKKHYDCHYGKEFYPLLESMITEGPVVALALEGVNCIEQVRKMIGSTEPRSALPGTIRGDFAHITYEYADNNKIAVKNLVHASDTPENAEKEVKLWFNQEELHNYSILTEKHTL